MRFNRAGLIIGGTTFDKEQANIPHTNILICTPGRLLQHMDETPNFFCHNVQLLILDEADRILDLGFAKVSTASALLCLWSGSLPTPPRPLLPSGAGVCGPPFLPADPPAAAPFGTCKPLLVMQNPCLPDSPDSPDSAARIRTRTRIRRT